MPLQPDEWNVVILGRWNPALFTPAAISQRIFHLPVGTPVEVYVVLDDIQLPRVKHEGITIAASTPQLIILPEKCSFSELDRARIIARDAITELPQTPLMGAGFNLRYRADEMPPSLADRFSKDLDRRFSDRDFQIVGRQFHRLLTFQNGKLLVRVSGEPDGKVELLVNFEFQSKEAGPLQEWLSLPIESVRKTVHTVLESVLDLRKEDHVIENC